MENQASQMLKTIIEYLDNLTEGSVAIAKKFQEGNEVQANGQLISYIDGLIHVVDTIETLKSTNVVKYDEIDNVNLSEKLLEMEQAMLKKDYVLLSDILEYEMSEMLQQLKDILASDKGQVLQPRA